MKNIFKTIITKGKKIKWFWAPLIVLVFLICFGTYLGYYRNRILPKIYLGSKNIGGTKIENLENILRQEWENKGDEFKIIISEKEYTINYADLNFDPDFNSSAEISKKIGRESMLSKRFWHQLKQPFSSSHIGWVFELNKDGLNSRLNEIRTDFEGRAIAPELVFKEDKYIINSGQDGSSFDKEEIARQIMHAWSNNNFNQIVINLEPTNFETDRVKLEEFLPEINAKLYSFRLSAGGKTKRVNPADISGWVNYYVDEDKITWSINQIALNNFLLTSGNELRVLPENARLTYVNGKLVVLKNAVTGKQIDIDQAVSVLSEGISRQDKEIVLPVKTLPAEITAENIDSLGIKEIIGTGTTSYKGSTANRAHNVANGASILNGVVIKPGEEFSTARFMGEVNDVNGFLPELVIKGNRTIPEFGGGLCQVSTTLFRSVLNAGLKVTARQNHSYRVSYYEPPVGLDATVYLPNPDFKFLNNTDNYILIQSKTTGTFITFDIYGTKDGRVATVSDPQILSTTPAGEPIYVETDTLFVGEVKRLERAHDGMTTVAYYTVTKDGKELFKQTFRSVYKAWPARYLVGTKPVEPAPEVLPPATPAPEAVPAV